MIFVIFLAFLILLLGRIARISTRVQGGLLTLLAGFVLLVHLSLPSDNPIRMALGGSLAHWAILIGLMAVFSVYVMILRRLKSRAAQNNPPTTNTPDNGPFSEDELERYARHIVLHEIGGAGQQQLKKARVLVIGAGGLGSPALLYLAAAGVGTIGVIDDDEVSLSNLQRQVLHSEDRIGMAKVFSAEQGLLAINHNVNFRPYNRRLEADTAAGVMDGYDLVMDGSDNFETRHLVNETCVKLGIPLISAAISQWEGQISLYHPASGAPCYACVFPDIPAPGLARSCSEIGVIGALPGVVGSMMALEAIKFITGAGQPLKGEMLIYDALYGESRKLGVHKRDDCKVCGTATASYGNRL